MELKKIVGKLEYDKTTQEFIRDEGYLQIHQILKGLGLLANNDPTDPSYYKEESTGKYWKHTEYENYLNILEEVSEVEMSTYAKHVDKDKIIGYPYKKV